MSTIRATFARPATAALVLLSAALVAVPLAGANTSRATVVEVSRTRAHTVLGALEASPIAEHDAVSRASSTPNDPEYDGSASPCTGSLACWPYQNVGLAPAWNATTGSSSVIVAVVDTGVDASHEDLSGAVLTGCNLVSGTITGGVCSDTDTGDDNGHGTEAAGLIAARSDNGLGISGVCGSCKILPVKALGSDGSGSDSNIALGIEWAADHGAKVISLSLAVGAADPVLHDAIAYAISRGALVVAGAGNAGSSNPTTTPAATRRPSPPTPTRAAVRRSASGLISVGADDYINRLYSFSNHGSWVDVSASGCGISTTTTAATRRAASAEPRRRRRSSPGWRPCCSPTARR